MLFFLSNTVYLGLQTECWIVLPSRFPLPTYSFRSGPMHQRLLHFAKFLPHTKPIFLFIVLLHISLSMEARIRLVCAYVSISPCTPIYWTAHGTNIIFYNVDDLNFMTVTICLTFRWIMFGAFFIHEQWISWQYFDINSNHQENKRTREMWNIWTHSH